MRRFMIAAPDGRMLLREAETAEGLRNSLIEGYALTYEVLDGNIQVEPLPDGLPQYTIMTHMLLRHGDELSSWLGKKSSAVSEAIKKNK